MNIFNKIQESYEKEKIPGLDQKGPKSLNYVNRKNEFVRVFNGNEKLRSTLENVKSDYGQHQLMRH